MTASKRITLLIPLFLMLSACPAVIKTSLNSVSSQPSWTIRLHHGTIKGVETIFLQKRFVVRSGENIIWQIDAARDRAECDPTRSMDEGLKLPAELRYGQTPLCFREIVAAKPLEEGRAYELFSDDDYYRGLYAVTEYFIVKAGRIKEISGGRYRKMNGME
jgi:hypothetical protein